MKNPITALARLFRIGTQNPVATTLHTHVIGRPLMVHPGIGAQLIGGYLSGAMDAPMPLHEQSEESATPGISVLNITGGLVSRPMPGLCDEGPTSYEAISAAFDRAVNDDSRTAIVLRMDTPGGMCSGCFDLTDRIYAARGTKPIIAVIDDMAYSAGYAIAAACDQIWITRTGGAGSVGVVAYHVDQSGMNEKIGIKVTPIFAGGHKVDFSPHAPLAEDALSREQIEVNSLYQMFVDSVAKYRGLSAEEVAATEALTYTGKAAIDAGLATHLGTFEDALASLAAPSVQALARAELERAQTELTSQRLDRAAAIDQLMTADLKTDLRNALLAPSAALTLANLTDRITHAQAVADLCAACGDRSLAGEFVSQHIPIESVRSQLIALKAADGPELITSPPVNPPTTALNAQSIYDKRRESARKQNAHTS